MEAPPIRRTVDIRRDMKRCASCGHSFSGEAAFCPFDGARLERTDRDSIADPFVGSLIDARYQVIALLGEGGMGQVYEVRHAALDRHFAMKILRRELARDEDLAARFLQEARATASVHHPHVVEITDFGKLPTGVPYFVMELLAGKTLGQVIKTGGPIPARRAVSILRQVAGALGSAHAAGIVHRDLKPDNVFLVGGVRGGTASDDVRVVDFGAAKIIGASRVTREGIVFGTPHYMSPEQASGQPVDHRADVYALGVIMYEMFTGRVPFEADTYMGVLTQHMFVHPMRPSQVSPAARGLGALEEITMACLAKKREERYGSMDELTAALDEVVHTRSDGRVEFADHLSARPSRAPPGIHYPMADELEPPSLAEMRVAIDSVLPPRRVIPWAFLIGVGAVLVSAAVAWALVAHRPAQVSALPAVPVAIPGPPPAPFPPLATATASTTLTPSARPSPSPAPPASAHATLPRKAVPAGGASIDDVGDPFRTP
jgi:eukaryotic-like serine/threonine-protein kinase